MIFCGIFVGDFVIDPFIGLGSLELTREPIRLPPFTVILLDRRMGILVGESLPNFRYIASFPQCDESCSQSLFGVPTIGDNVVGLEIRFNDRDGVNDVDGPIPKSIIDPPNSLLVFRRRRGDTEELSRRLLKRSVLLLDIRLSRLTVDMLLFREIFGVDTLLFLRGIRDG